MTRVLIADDLTGALDAGLQAYRAGLLVETVFDLRCAAPAASRLAAGTGDALLCVDTETRNLQPSAAHDRVREILSLLLHLGVQPAYKKVDSTLRGPIAAELSAFLEQADIRVVLVAPALPALGRATRDGVHLVHGRMIEETEYAADPAFGKPTSMVREHVADDTKNVVDVRLGVVRQGPQAVADVIDTALRSAPLGSLVAVADAETDSDLRVISRVCAASHGTILPCGSAGLFGAFMAENRTRPAGASAALAADRAERQAADAPVLVVSGSSSAVTKQQIVWMERAGSATVLRPDRSSLQSQKTLVELGRMVESGTEVLRSGRNLIVDCAGDPRLEPAEDRGRISDAVELTAAGVSSELLSRICLSGLVVTGGATARAVCGRLGAGSLAIVGEAGPYIPTTEIRGGRHDGTIVVTKAGGFGAEDALQDVVAALRG